uniref:PLD phosphodiesterase domain-containing protein n=1 Tax=Plectus sambesii TaxID=2011161 RepID=A0A914VZY1_9BILA
MTAVDTKSARSSVAGLFLLLSTPAQWPSLLSPSTADRRRLRKPPPKTAKKMTAAAYGDDKSGSRSYSWLRTAVPVLTLALVPLMAVMSRWAYVPAIVTPPRAQDSAKCLQTCTLDVVESIPMNVTFGSAPLPQSTFSAWRSLIMTASEEIQIAAYKSSLRGKHVLGDSHPFSYQGEEIFDLLVNAGRDRGVPIRMVENFPPKDRGDNEDGKSLARRGAVERRSLHFSKIFGTGTMHSKFLVVDRTHFYLGSANLDWRSLNQKMELGVLMKNCPCMAEDLHAIFSSYWELTSLQNMTVKELDIHPPKATYNREHPLSIMQRGVETQIYLA